MVPYIAAFTIAYIFAFLSESRSVRKTKILSYLFLFFAAAIISLLAALRADTIGTDVKTYVIKYFNEAGNSNSFIKYLAFLPDEAVEPGYKLFNYIIARFTDDIRVLLFLISFFDVSFVLAYLLENKKKLSVSFGLLVYMFMQYNIGFNAVRQTMAVCVCLYSFNAARDRKLIKFIILMAIALSFHISAVIMIISYPLAAIFEKRTKQDKNKLIFIITSVSVVILICINTIIAFFVRAGLFPEKFNQYKGANFSISRFSAFIFLIPAFILFLLYKKKYFANDKFNAVLFLYVILWPITAQLDSVSNQLGRIAFYFNIANIGIYAQLPKIKHSVRNKTTIKIITLLIAIFLFFYWFMNYCVWNVGQTVPYVFRK